jgi:hypothetical protein
VRCVLNIASALLRVGSQSYGTCVCGQLPFSVEYEGSGDHSASGWTGQIYLQQSPVSEVLGFVFLPQYAIFITFNAFDITFHKSFTLSRP